MLVVVEKTTYQAQSLEQSYSQTKTEPSHSNRDPCVTILSVTVEMFHTHALYSSSQVGMDAGL